MEVGESWSEADSGKRLHLKKKRKNKKSKSIGAATQVVECLSSKCQAMSSNTTSTVLRKRKTEKEMCTVCKCIDTQTRIVVS
jgi:hypothetical protein